MTMLNIYLVIFITLVAALLASVAQLLYKKGLSKNIAKMHHVLAELKNRRVLAGVALYVISLVVYLYALSAAPLSVVYPCFASTFIFIAIISSVWLREKLPAKRIAGVLLIFLGIVIIASTL